MLSVSQCSNQQCVPWLYLVGKWRMCSSCHDSSSKERKEGREDKERKKKKINCTTNTIQPLHYCYIILFICMLSTAVNVNAMLCKYSSIQSLIPSTSRTHLVQISVITLCMIRYFKINSSFNYLYWIINEVISFNKLIRKFIQ